MDNMDTDSEALEQILGDMDSMEGKRVYGDKPAPAAGVSITIDVAPKGPAEEKKEEPKLDEEPMPEDESGMPPFLRKRN